jgi:hypothetical protein
MLCLVRRMLAARRLPVCRSQVLLDGCLGSVRVVVHSRASPRGREMIESAALTLRPRRWTHLLLSHGPQVCATLSLAPLRPPPRPRPDPTPAPTSYHTYRPVPAISIMLLARPIDAPPGTILHHGQRGRSGRSIGLPACAREPRSALCTPARATAAARRGTAPVGGARE